MRRTLAALALVAMIGAGCSDESADDADTATSTERAAETTTGRSRAVRFAECMRDNGVSAFPDPDASGELTLDGVVNGSSLDPDSPAWRAAMDACRDLQPAGFTGHRRSAAQQKAALAFARCMREAGIEDFPDPTEDGPLIDTTQIPSAAGRGALEIPGFKAAQDRCGDLARDALAGR